MRGGEGTSRSRIATVALLALSSLFALASCDEVPDEFKRKNNPADDPLAPKCTETGKGYVGFAGTKLEEKRVNAVIT